MGLQMRSWILNPQGPVPHSQLHTVTNVPLTKHLEAFATISSVSRHGSRIDDKNFLILTAQPGASYKGDFHVSSCGKPCEQKQLAEAVGALGLLVQRGSHVHKSILHDVLKRCIAQKDLVLGSRVHALCVKCGYESNAFLANHLICMYASHGRLKEAIQVFTKVAIPSRYMWASIILAYARQGEPTKAINLYKQMRYTSLKPDNHIFSAVVKACGIGKDLCSAREIYADIVGAADKPNLFVGNCLIDMFSKCGSLEDACTVFDYLPIRDVVTWNSMITGYVQHGFGEKALTLYANMQQEGITQANHVTYLCLLQACASAGALHQGKQLHKEISDRGLEADVAVGNYLINMYAKCGSLNDAHRVFDNMPTKDVVTWNTIIAGYAHYGSGQEALTLYESMLLEGVTQGDAFTFACLLQASGNLGALCQGKQLHAQIQERGLETDVVVGTCLVDMYVKCGSLEDARRVFDCLPARNVVTCTAMIAGYTQHGLGQESLSLYAEMLLEGVTPANQVTFVFLLQACSSIRALHQGRLLHLQIQERGLESDVMVGTCLVDMYAKCGSLEDARRVFDNLPNKNVATWTCMIAGLAENGLSREAITLYVWMREEGFTPVDAATFICLLQAFASMGALHHGKQLHADVQRRGLETDVVIGNCLINLYAKCGRLEDARHVFDTLASRDVVTWNIMIAGYYQGGHSQEALALYAKLLQEDTTSPDGVTFIYLLQACATMGSLCQGKQLHAQILKSGLEADMVVGTCLVEMYAQCGSLDNARRVFDSLATRDVVTWTAIIAGYAQHGLSEEAITLFGNMQQEGITAANAVTFVCVLQACGSVAGLEKGKEIHVQISKTNIQDTDNFVVNTLIDMYGKCGSMADAQHVFDSLPTKDTVTWNALIAGYARQGESKVVFNLLERMRQQSIQPNGVTFLSVITVCSHEGLVDRGQMYFEVMITYYGITPTIEHYCCMADLLGRAGLVERAMEMVKEMPLHPDTAMWKCVMGACQKWSNVELARQAFEFAIRLDEKDAALYVLMSNIYSAAQMQDDAREIQAMRVEVQAWKMPGQSWWTDFGGIAHVFMVGVRHPECQYIDAQLTDMFIKMKDAGYVQSSHTHPATWRQELADSVACAVTQPASAPSPKLKKADTKLLP